MKKGAKKWYMKREGELRNDVARTQSVEYKAVNKAGFPLLALLSIVAAVNRTSFRGREVAVHRSLHTGKWEETADRDS